MSSDKDEYIESVISLDGKWPQFCLEGDNDSKDVVLRLASHNQKDRLVISTEASEELGCDLELYFEESSNYLTAIRFPQSSSKWKIERVSIRYEEDRNMIYIRFRWFLRQELSLEIEELSEDLVLDLDKKDRLIGFAITNVSEHIKPEILETLKSDGQWIKLATYGKYTSIDQVKLAKKTKKQQKRALATEAARATATPSPAIFDDPSSSSSSKGLSDVRSNSPFVNPKKKRVYNGPKLNLIPQEATVALNPNEDYRYQSKDSNNSVSIRRSYFVNRFVRDLEWVLNFPFILKNVDQGDSEHQNGTQEVKYNVDDESKKYHNIPIVNSSWINLGMSTDQFLTNLDKNPEHFLSWIKERNSRSNNLGGYFSLLIEYLLSNAADVKQVLPKYQMCEGKRTIGDFDFLFQTSVDDSWIHWEVGIKFYLLLEGSKASDGWKKFVGPHCTGDSLDKYVTKTVKQLELCNVEQLAQQLRQDDKFPSQSSFFLKGYIFLPLTHKYYQELSHDSIKMIGGNLFDSNSPTNEDTQIGLSAYINTTRGYLYDRAELDQSRVNGGPVSGWWVKYHHQFPYNEIGDAADPSEENLELVRHDHSLEEDILLLESEPITDSKREKLAHSYWTILNKMDYMAPILVTPDRPDIQLLTYSALKRTVKMCFAANYRSLFISEVVPYSRSQYKDCPNPLNVSHIEVSRGFVVGEHWPKAPQDVDVQE